MPTSNRVSVPGQQGFLIPTQDAGQVSTSFARPNDSVNYAAGDQITGGSILTFTPSVAFAAGGGLIVSCNIVQSTAPVTPPTLELWLFDTLPTFTFTDNIAFAPADADADMVCGVLPILAAGQFKSANNMIHSYSGNPVAFNPSSGLAIYGILVVRNAYNPTALETFKIKLGLRTF